MNKKDTCFMVGHAHIDAAWLWPVEETIEVCHCTFSSALKIMEEYPHFYFSQSSAQYYEWMEEKFPQVFEKIKKQVKEGHWDIIGGMWVEPDCNLSSGESLVRQILYGKRYFLEKFGVEVEVAWLPDTFGFCWTLPQIFKKSGIRYFVTSKLNWQTTLRFPYHIFWWQAPDGSKILACQTVGGYGHTSLDGLKRELNFLKKHQGINYLLFIYGVGDHGGGPTKEMIEEIIKFSSQENAPRILFSKAEDYFNNLEKLSKEGKTLPVVSDELYLKTHRGTYTSQAKVKLNNRKSECLLENAEKFASIAKRYGLTYPQKGLELAWKKLLFNQFHDILAGSSIPKVYQDSEKDYTEVFRIGKKILFSSLKQIAGNINTKGEGKSILVFNSLSWDRDGLVKTKLSSLGDIAFVRILDEKKKIIPYQIIEEDGRKILIFLARNVPSLGYKEYKVIPIAKKEIFQTDLTLREQENSIELKNEFYRIIIEKKSGHLTSVYDKLNKKELLDNSRKGGAFQIYEDFSLTESAWNIWLGRLEELKNAEKVEIIEEGPLRYSARIKYIYKEKKGTSSILIQEIRLYSNLPVIEFKINLDWQAPHKMLKVAFPLNLHAEEATYNIPYGTIQRKIPTSPEADTTERVKWEVSALKWIDYTDKEKNYGVSLLSDSRYGFDVKDDTIRMSLLRTPDYPDPLMMDLKEQPPQIMDQGKHIFSYALFPHKGNWKEANSMRKGYEFNYLLLSIIEPSHSGPLPKGFSFIKIYPENIILKVIKKAEDSETLILRAYETIGQKTQAQILFPESPLEIWETDMMEREISNLPTEEKLLKISFGAYEIKTLKVII